MNYKTEWVGSHREMIDIVDTAIAEIVEDQQWKISDNEARRLFCDAFSRHLVQKALANMMLFLKMKSEEEEEFHAWQNGCTE